jgi:hypothetical protein
LLLAVGRLLPVTAPSAQPVFTGADGGGRDSARTNRRAVAIVLSIHEQLRCASEPWSVTDGMSRANVTKRVVKV